MYKVEYAGLCVLVAGVFMCAGFACGAWLCDYRAEMESLRHRVSENEIRMYQWKGRLDALYEVRVEIHVVDTSQIVTVEYVGEIGE